MSYYFQSLYFSVSKGIKTQKKLLPLLCPKNKELMQVSMRKAFLKRLESRGWRQLSGRVFA